MFSLEDIFTSKAVIKVLRVLYFHSSPLLLRHIAYIADVPVYSIQRALKQLESDKVVIKKKKKHYTYFTLSKNHTYYDFIAKVFRLQMEYTNRLHAAQLNKKAKSVLEFSNSAHAVIKKAKKV
jgi:DNA-binding transcriptional regulator GbsR (MarR family)